MEQTRIPKKSYEMLLDLDTKGKVCWVSKVREILCETGFASVWLCQTIGNPVSFLKQLKQRLIDMFIQEWSGGIRDRERYTSYSNFKVLFEKERYISFVDTSCFRAALSQFRFGVLPLNNNMHRYSQNAEKRACPYCLTRVENEEHFIFSCPLYTDLMKKFLHGFSSMILLCQVDSLVKAQLLSKFVFYAIKMRKRFLLGEILSDDE